MNGADTAGGFDMELGDLAVHNHSTIDVLSKLRVMRASAHHVGARASATKCLVTMLSFADDDAVTLSEVLVQEAPTVTALQHLGLAERRAGRYSHALRAFTEMRQLADAAGDLDGVSGATRALAEIAGQAGPRSEDYHLRLTALQQAAGMHPSDAYREIQQLIAEADGLSAHHTALECRRGLVVAAAIANDPQNGRGFAAEVLVLERGAWGYLALLPESDRCA